MTRYVQHKSGMGEKWEVNPIVVTLEQDWCVWRQDKSPLCYYLPKSEYVEVPAPEVWVDVTDECAWDKDNIVHDCGHWKQKLAIGSPPHILSDYRLRKVEVNMIGPGIPNGCQKHWAFIVERKTP